MFGKAFPEDNVSIDRAEEYTEQVRSINGEAELCRFEAPANNYEPWDGRYRLIRGYAVRYTTDRGNRAYGLFGSPEVRRMIGSAALIEDGWEVNTPEVRPFYVAAYRDSKPGDTLMDGVTPVPDGDIDPHVIFHLVTPLQGWELGPRKAFHIKVYPFRVPSSTPSFRDDES